MTPLKIEILLHYCCNRSEYRDGHLSAPAVREALEWGLHHDLLRVRADGFFADDGCDATYEATDRCRALIEAMCEMPLPVQVWTMPKER